MKKVFLSLAVIAALTVVSCKQSENKDAAPADTTAVVVDSTTTKTTTDTVATKVATPAAEAPAAAPAKK